MNPTTPARRAPLIALPVAAPVQSAAFNLPQTLAEALAAAGEALRDGDVLAVSSKYAAIAEGRVKVDRAVDTRKRAKLRPGQSVTFAGETVLLVGESE